MLLALFLVCAEPRDPFTSILESEVTQYAGDRTPIERVPLDAIKLAGVVDDASPRALITLPDGSSHVLRVGDVVGEHFGVVKAIGHGRVVVVEHFHNAIGASFASTHVLTLR